VPDVARHLDGLTLAAPDNSHSFKDLTLPSPFGEGGTERATLKSPAHSGAWFPGSCRLAVSHPPPRVRAVRGAALLCDPVSGDGGIRARRGIRARIRESDGAAVQPHVIAGVEVVYPTQPVMVSVGFAAGARTFPDGAVLLSFEMVEHVRGIDGLPHGGATLTLMNEDGGTLTEVKPGVPTTARHWVGSGLRTGHLVLALRAETAGRYMVPIRVTLSAP
jgi:hypothetical protein